MGLSYVAQRCNVCCLCVEQGLQATVPPADPADVGPSCESERDASEQVIANECVEGDPLTADNIICSESEYGKPVNAACVSAISSITTNIEEPLQIRQFLGIGALSSQPRRYQTVQTPQSYGSGKSLNPSSS
ncbi:hypothetical protein MMC12_006144, partial [Toensbergia leucococca]|nr:hypothetical protein [Toensbergia leucococca]